MGALEGGVFIFVVGRWKIDVWKEERLRLAWHGRAGDVMLVRW